MSKQVSRVRLTAGRVEAFACPADKSQVFLWDTDTPSLAVRATPTGRKTYVFESRLNGATIRTTIGSVKDWPLDAPERDKDAMSARREASRLATMVNSGIDPREVEKEKQAAKHAKKAAEAMQTATVGEAWEVYLAERRTFWGDKHYQDHVSLAHAGGESRKRTKGAKTIAGPLAHFMSMRLADLDNAAVHTWAQKEAKARRARASLSLRLLKAFLRWCAAEDAYKAVTDPTAASGKKTREVIGKPKEKSDCLQREQLAAWFTHVRQIQNPVISAYLQCLLITGARREELAELKWEDVNFQWNGISMKDKIEDSRPVPLTPYVSQLLASLPRRNEWVFSSMKAVSMDAKHIARRAAYHAKHGTPKPKSANRSESGRLVEPSIAHRKACAAAGLNGLTLHGLRRSFASLCEWLDIPGGISAQIQGHAPQGVREQNYIRRPLDLLRVHHEKIEAWMLEQAGIKFDAKARPGTLRAVL